ncbi:MAG: ATP-dependent DNA helicase [Acidimicrobiia bacterium]
MTQVKLSPFDWPEAIAETRGRQLVVAGPGTGKTEFLVRRVGHIVEAGLAQPSQIVVLTFSRRASARLDRRINETTGSGTVPVDVGTFHALALRTIETVSGGERPVPLTTPEQVAVVRTVLAEEDPANWPVPYRGILTSHVFSEEVADFLLRCSERLLTPADLAERARDRADWRGLPGLYARYLEHLSDTGRTDYGVLLSTAVDILGSQEGMEVVDNFRFVLVDEYQDTTPAQAAMADLLASAHGNLTVAGDPYQSIFSFRGAELRNVAAFSDHPDTKRIVLSSSFRVPAEIMESALRIVSGGELPGSAGVVSPATHAGRSEAYLFDQETAEAEWIAREVEHAIHVEGVSPSAIAVLVRSKKELLNELSRALTRRSVPHDPPDSRLVDHPGVKIFGDLGAVAVGDAEGSLSPTASVRVDQAMRRLLLGPLVGLTISQERSIARDRLSGPKRWADVLATQLPARQGLIQLISNAEWATGVNAADGFWRAWSLIDGLEEIVRDPRRAEWRRAWAAFAQMLSRQAERDPSVTLARFFEMVDEEGFEATPLIAHRMESRRVTLTTLHQAKGLEFDIVFIANAVEGVFPDLRRSRRMLRPELLSPERTTDPAAQHLFQLQEEMRLAYTAMTRARKRVVWSATEAGVDQGERRPSRFLVAAAGDSPLGPPTIEEREPVTIAEAETMLRRTLIDVSAPPARRLAAASVLAAPARPWWDPRRFAGVPRPGPDTGVVGEAFWLSPSQAVSYRDCPRRYVLERRLRLGDSTSVYAHFGELAHEILEKAEREVIGTGERHATLRRVLQILDETWAHADFGSPALTEAWKEKAVAMLTKLYEHWPGRGQPIDVERTVEKDIAGVPWTGRVDRLERNDEGTRVVDYKTSGRAMTRDDAAESIQLAFYALAVRETGEEVIASEMWYPRTTAASVTTRGLAMHMVDEVEDRLVDIAERITAEDWAPRVSKSCDKCDFKHSCPAWPEGRGAFLP